MNNKVQLMFLKHAVQYLWLIALIQDLYHFLDCVLKLEATCG